MAICVISTTGTSVFSNAHAALQNEWKSFQKNPTVDLLAICKKDSFEGLELYNRTLEYLRAETKASNATEIIRRASAELNSLSRILVDPPTRSDQLHFLATSTPDGALAARVICDFSREYFSIENAEIHLIEGLQVHDGEIFRKDGVRNLIATIYKIFHNAPSGTYSRIINPTGGFKGVVPYLTLIGMMESNVTLSYIYEQSPALITLGRIPVQFDFGVLESAYPALKACSEDLVDETKLKELLTLSTDKSLSDHPAWSLFDNATIDGQIYFAVNGLGQIVLEHLRARDQKPIYLSKQAAERFDKLDTTQQKKFQVYFERLRDPAWIDSHRHDEVQNDGGAIPIKPGNVDERLFIYRLDDGSILVAELAFHKPNGSYDRIPKRRRDYDAYRLWGAR